MRYGEWAGYNPKGAVMDDGVFVWHMDVPYENSRPARGPGAHSAEGVPPGACFFGSFLCTSKERNAPVASGDIFGPKPRTRKTHSTRSS